MEPERYELQSGPMYDFSIDRREFFARIGGGLVDSGSAGRCRGSGIRGKTPRRIRRERFPKTLVHGCTSARTAT